MSSTDRSQREYGRGGWIGLGTPQANPTMEAEFRRLLPPDVDLLVTRLRGDAGSSEQRMVDYIEQLPRALQAYDTLKPDVFGFGNTGSSYLVGAKREAEIRAAVEREFGYPVVTAAGAVLEALRALGAGRIAILAPYPQPIIDASVAFWEAAGLRVAAVRRIDIGSDDTRNIYGLRAADALGALADLPVRDADAVLLSGTGMPSLAAIGQAAPLLGKPVVSSNYCLAWALLRVLGDPRPIWDAATGPTLPLSLMP
ncbi:MAG: hypothetical protein KDC18_02650 [Alphaproteobacteria bacterium]|nr:hypothetical protein [Alphaproteobacteria bacterium]MCB9929024.1 hypothetical protein [Alphaproteobacteria bacterium]